jgi:hypothetical protein
VRKRAHARVCSANPVADNSDVARRITWQEEQMHAGIHDQAIDYGDLETCKHHFGYTTGEPCFGIAVNRVIDWKLPKLTETVCKHVCAMRILNCAQLKCQLTSLLYESDINTCAVNDQFSTNAHLLCYGYQPADRFHAPLLFRCVYARVDQHMRRYYPAAGLRHTTVEYEHIASGADQLKSKIFVVQAVNMPCGVLVSVRCDLINLKAVGLCGCVRTHSAECASTGLRLRIEHADWLCTVCAT